jgi:predicted TIM-barrel fold metal-dependent hydrolase
MSRPETEHPVEWKDYFQPAWLARRREEALEPELPIVDPHHHIWGWLNYGLDELLADLGAGHNVRQTVYLESHLAYDETAPAHLQAVGETRYLVGLTEDSRLKKPGAPDVCAGIIGSVDLDGTEAEVDEALEAHIAAGKGRFKGVRFSAWWHEKVSWQEGRRAGMAADPTIRRNLGRLAKHGLVCDVMAFHYQLGEVAAMAAALPDVTFVVNHYGGFLGRMAKHEGYDAARRLWREGIEALARQPNVVIKLGGLNCDFFSGIQLHLEPEPPSSQTIEQVSRPFFEPCIELFGADRCMFESNYPADRQQVDYTILWNGFKRLAAGASADEKAALFMNTAQRVYSLA